MNCVSLGKVSTVVRGITFKPDDVTDCAGGNTIRCFRTKNVQAVLDVEDVWCVPRSFVKRNELLVRRGDCLVSTANSWNLVGKAAWVPELPWEATLGGFIAAFRPGPSIDARYLYHWITNPRTQHALRLCGRQTTNISNLDIGRALELKLPLPPFAEQKRIAAILDKADAIRARRREALAQADALLRATFDHMVGHRAPNYESWEPRTIESLTCDRPNALRTGPFGSDLRHSEFTDSGIVVLGIDNAVQNRFAWAERRYISPEKYAKLERYRVFPGDVIVTIMGTTGRSAVVPENIPLAISTKHLATITLNLAEADPHFISFAIHSDSRLRRQIEAANKGAIMDGLNLTIMRNLKVHLPPLPLQQRFARLVRWHQTQQEQAQDPAANGDALYASLAQRAFRGEL